MCCVSLSLLVLLLHSFVPQAENRETGVLAALKRVPIQDETELEDFMVEIDILTECKHPKIVGLHQAFFHDSALWVRPICSFNPYPQYPYFQFVYPNFLCSRYLQL